MSNLSSLKRESVLLKTKYMILIMTNKKNHSNSTLRVAKVFIGIHKNLRPIQFNAQANFLMQL